MQDIEIITKLINNLEGGKAVYFSLKNEETGNHRTFRIKKQGNDEWMPGGILLGYLSDSDNNNSYTNFAFINKFWVNCWKKYQGTATEKLGKLVEQVILQQKPNEKLEIVPAGRCYRCGRQLTVPSSVHRGLGPECASKV